MPSLTVAQRTAAYRRRRYGRRFVLPAGGVEKTVTFPGTALRSRCWIALGADLTQSYLSWNWLDITEWVRWEQGTTIVKGRRDQADRVDASTARLTIENDGRFSRKNPLGPYYGLLTRHTPIWIANDPGTGYSDRYFGFVNEWPKRWDRSGEDSTVRIECRGLMHRLLRSRTLRSPLYRMIRTSSPIAYWPLEDGVAATLGASGILGGPSMTGDIEFEASVGPDGASSAVSLADRGEAIGVITGCGTTSWRVEHIAFWPDNDTPTPSMSLEITSSGSISSWRINVNDSPEVLRVGYLVAGASVYTQIDSTVAPFDGEWRHIRLDVTQDGADVDVVLTVNGAQVLSSTISSQTMGAATDVRLATFEDTADSDLPDVGHIAVWSGTLPTLDTYNAMLAHVGEQADERIGRICEQEGISLFCQAATSATLGPEPKGTVLDVLRAAEKADQGVLYEHQFGFGYQALSERYNVPVALELDIAEGHLIEDLEPADNDLRFRNQWTAHRLDGASDGSSATIQGRAGVAGVELGPTEAIYDDEDRFSVETDEQLPDLAGWLVHRDSLDEDYWPNVAFSLAKHPALIPTWQALGYGSRITVANVMDEAGVDTIDAVVEGYAEFWNSKEWHSVLNTSPTSPFAVLQLDSDQFGRLDSGSSTLADAAAAGASSLSVSTPTGLWATSGAEFPLTVVISGIEVTVTAIAGASSPQTFTVVGASVTKALASGDEVHVAPAVVLGL